MDDHGEPIVNGKRQWNPTLHVRAVMDDHDGNELREANDNGPVRHMLHRKWMAMYVDEYRPVEGND